MADTAGADGRGYHCGGWADRADDGCASGAGVSRPMHTSTLPLAQLLDVLVLGIVASVGALFALVTVRLLKTTSAQVKQHARTR